MTGVMRLGKVFSPQLKGAENPQMELVAKSYQLAGFFAAVGAGLSFLKGHFSGIYLSHTLIGRFHSTT